MKDQEEILLDATGLICPMPLLKAKRALNSMKAGQKLRILATDQTSNQDFKRFSEQSGHKLLSSRFEDGVYNHLFKKKG